MITWDLHFQRPIHDRELVERFSLVEVLDFQSADVAEYKWGIVYLLLDSASLVFKFSGNKFFFGRLGFLLK